jgi:hypothetical protein
MIYEKIPSYCQSKFISENILKIFRNMFNSLDRRMIARYRSVKTETIANSQVQAGRYFVIVSLLEAEHLRSCMHISRRDGATGMGPGCASSLALRLLPSGEKLEQSPGYVESPGHFQTVAAAQLARFLDSATDYNKRDLVVLQRLLGGISAEARSRFFIGVRSCRRRQQVWTASVPSDATIYYRFCTHKQGDEIAPVVESQVPTAETSAGRLLAADIQQLGELRRRAVAVRIRFTLAQKGFSIADGFAAMDIDKQARLRPDLRLR